MEISQEQYNELATKAAKWDALDTRISEAYSDEESDIDLADIGEIAASAFGYL